MKILKLFLVVVFLLGAFSTNSLAETKKRYYYIKDGKKVYVQKPKRKLIKREIKVYKDGRKVYVNTYAPTKKYIKRKVKRKTETKPEAINPSQETQETANAELVSSEESNLSEVSKPQKIQEQLKTHKEAYYLKAGMRFVKRERAITLETNDLRNSGVTINLDGEIIPADGRTYAKNSAPTESPLALFIGKNYKEQFIEAGVIMLDQEAEYDLAYGTHLNKFGFSTFGSYIIPNIKLIAGGSYYDFAVEMPDSLYLGGALGFMNYSTSNINFDSELFFKSKFYREISAEYGVEDVKENQVGLSLGIRYSL